MKWHKDTITLFFDYDGTLHESLKIYAPAFRLAQSRLVDAGLAPSREYSDPEIARWLGYSTEEMWDSFLPDLPDKHKKQAGNIIGDEMLRLTLAGKAALYPGTLETLSSLKKAGFHMVFLSNCRHSYMEVHSRIFGLKRYFDAFYCIEDFPFSSKAEMYHAASKSHPGTHVIIGDRKQDMEIGQIFHIPSVGCCYGYGTLQELGSASCTIDTVKELSSLFLTD